MKITQEDVVKHQTVLNIELDEDDLPPYLAQGYRRVVNRVSIPGFRKGKAPLEVVERFLGRESLLHESMDVMLPEMTERAITEQELETAGRPDIEIVELDPVIFKATVALKPIVDLGAYSNIRVTEQSVDVTEEDIQARIGEMQNGAASWEPVERSVALGDMITMNVTAKIEGSEILNETNAVYVADADSELPFKGFPQELEGVELEVARDFSLDISDDHDNSEIAGKTADFSVIVSEIKERSVPDIDDDFAKGIGDGHDSLEALQDSVREILQSQAEESANMKYRDDSLDALIGIANIELPPLLIEHEIRRSTQRRDQLIERLQMQMDDYLRYTGKTETEMQEEMEEVAVKELSRSYALSALAELEELEVTEDEISTRVQELMEANKSNDQNRRIDGERLRAEVKASLLTTKSLDQLILIARGELKSSTDDPSNDDRNE